MALKEGKFIGKAIAGQFGESPEKKTGCFGMLFEFNQGTKENPDFQKEWGTVWFSDTALKDGTTVKQKSFETMALCGYDDSKGNLPDGSVPIEYFNGSEVQLTLEAEKYIGKDGQEKSKIKIKWINPVGGSQFAGQDPTLVKNVVSNLNLKAEMAAARAKLGLKTPSSHVKNHAPGSANPPAPKFDTEAEIPF